jgi:hypothetical protein
MKCVQVRKAEVRIEIKKESNKRELSREQAKTTCACLGNVWLCMSQQGAVKPKGYFQWPDGGDRRTQERKEIGAGKENKSRKMEKRDEKKRQKNRWRLKRAVLACKPCCFRRQRQLGLGITEGVVAVARKMTALRCSKLRTDKDCTEKRGKNLKQRSRRRQMKAP